MYICTHVILMCVHVRVYAKCNTISQVCFHAGLPLCILLNFSAAPYTVIVHNMYICVLNSMAWEFFSIIPP